MANAHNGYWGVVGRESGERGRGKMVNTAWIFL